MIGSTVSHYRILEQLGAGGMGVVYRAEDRRLDRIVALKFLAPEFVRDADAKARFIHEARAASALDHPNICTIHGIEETEDGRLFIVMSCYQGETLADRIARGPLVVEEAVEVAMQMGQGLAKAHGLGIVHRDIKPANVFLTSDGLIKLLDFGIAKLTGATRDTRTGALLGTIHYMSPEQLQGEEADRRTDLWSLGVVVYEMLCGKLPFTGEQQQAIAYAIVNAEPPALGELRRDLPSALELAVAKCMQKEPGERYPGVQALLGALEPLAGLGDSRLLRQRTAGQHTLADARGVQPYPGLASFSEQDAEYFHGRESQVEAVWQKLRHGRLVAVAGPSGVGKTSFLRAGLVPARPKNWGVLLVTPGGSPFLSLREALVRELSGDTEAIVALLRENDTDTDVATVRRWRQRHDEALLILDQFEELFTLSPPEEQARFADLMSRLIFEADVRVLVSMRDDFLYQCYQYAGLAPVVEALNLLNPLSGVALRQALVQPALDCGYALEDEALIDEMMAEVEDERGALPLLAFTMARLWERRDRENGLLTRRAYAEIGSVGGALVQHAETVMEQIGGEGHPIVREIFRNLVTAQGTRGVQDREQLLSVFGEAERPAAEAILGRLIDARLLTTYETKGEDGRAQRRVEIVHESLLSAWPRLVRWQTQDADSAQLRDQLRQAAQLWEQKGRTDDLLWTGTAYQEFALWRERYPGGLSKSEESFARAMALRAVRRRRRRRIAVGSVFAALLAVLAVVWNLGQQARNEARRSEAARLLMFAEDMDMSEDNTLVLATATNSLELNDTPEARRLALTALTMAPARLVLTPPDTLIGLFAAVLDPGGRFLATVNEDGVLIWPQDGGEPLSLTCEEPAVRHRAHDIDVHPEGKYVVAARVPAHLEERAPLTERLLTIWSVEDGRHLQTWTAPEAHGLTFYVRGEAPHVYAFVADATGESHSWLRYSLDSDTPEELGTTPSANVWVSRNGRRALYPDGQDVCLAWIDSLQSGTPVLIGRHDSKVINPVFNHEENLIASVDQAGVVRVWSCNNEGSFELLHDRHVNNRINFLAGFDRSSLRLAYASGNMSRIDILDLEHPRARPTRLLPARAFVGIPFFSPDNRWLACGWIDERLGGGLEYYFYSMDSSRPRTYRVLPDEEGLEPEFFLADGSTLVARNNKRELLLCEVLTCEPNYRSLWENEGDFECAMPGPDGRYVCVNNWRQQRSLLIPTDGSEPIILDKPQGIIYGMDVEPGGHRVAVSGGQRWAKGMPDEPIITIHDLHTGAKQVLQAEGECGFYGVGFLPDERLFSYSHEGLLLWDLRSGEYELLSDRAYDFRPSSLDASKRFLLVHSPEGMTLWDLQARTERFLPIPTENLWGFMIAPDASFVLAAMVDGSVLFLPLDTEELHLFLGHSTTVTASWISPDSKEIRTADDGGLVCSWDVPTGPRLHTLPHAKLVDYLRAQTNMRVVLDVAVEEGYRILYDRFPGWDKAPSWYLQED